MKTVLNLFYDNPVLVCFVILLCVLLLLQASTLSKRHLRKAELEHLLGLIRDPNGRADALKLYNQCVHLSRVYFIPLSHVGIKGGRKELMSEVFKSQRRATERERRVLEMARTFPGFSQRVPLGVGG